MRLNVEKVIRAWEYSRAEGRKGSSIWTDGTTIYSYGTAIATELPDGGFVLNATKYSHTTSAQQNAIRETDIHFVEISGIEMGISGGELAKLGEEQRKLGSAA